MRLYYGSDRQLAATTCDELAGSTGRPHHLAEVTDGSLGVWACDDAGLSALRGIYDSVAVTYEATP